MLLKQGTRDVTDTEQLPHAPGLTRRGPSEDKYLPTSLEAAQLSSGKQTKTKPSGNVFEPDPGKHEHPLLPAEKARKPWKLCLKVGKAENPSSAHTPGQGGKGRWKERGLLGMIWGLSLRFFFSPL